ncbi:uncharacterized protein LOC112449943 [Kryptolebias marmoratus]|uniref:uncharacterized protein LOC112449943 n=1 Tax=Kryptolebias marmoratus TaxID=37003 RepID=UPI000D530D0E|nr:uncharacterized protein LOC112449943 [Kryptolebias marmoratus]
MLAFTPCSFVVTTWSLWICFLHSGSVAVISVNQPPEVTVALGHDAVLPCDFQASPDETITATPVLYWFTDSDDLLKSDGKYAGRVHRLDQNSESENKSIVLKRVQWSDSKKYECKGSFTTRQRGSFRKTGNLTSLIVYGSMTFNLSSHNASLLRCEVLVSQRSSLVLSVSQDRCLLQSVALDAERLQQTQVRLSQEVHLERGGNYECQLRLGTRLLTRSFFHTSVPADSGRHPEPWVLYVSLLLVQTFILLVLLVITLLRR